ncbi:hypothetical protein BJY04DRAFT_224370 [Aspergillus karnatakaensis]|uniref:uncharacterized protein n=1 Tax=Aspergillus karnatakaensis TaxID=1810916 RepID=UPI003CCE0132
MAEPSHSDQQDPDCSPTQPIPDPDPPPKYPESCLSTRTLTDLPPYTEFDPRSDFDYEQDVPVEHQAQGASTAGNRTQTAPRSNNRNRTRKTKQRRHGEKFLCVLLCLIIIGGCVGGPVGAMLGKKKHDAHAKEHKEVGRTELNQHQKGPPAGHAQVPAPVPAPPVNGTGRKKVSFVTVTVTKASTSRPTGAQGVGGETPKKDVERRGLRKLWYDVFGFDLW